MRKWIAGGLQIRTRDNQGRPHAFLIESDQCVAELEHLKGFGHRVEAQRAQPRLSRTIASVASEDQLTRLYQIGAKR